MEQQRCFRRIIVLALLCFIFMILGSCYSSKKKSYYEKKNNYVCATGIVSSINYDDETSTIYINFSKTTPAFDDTCFKIVGENSIIVQENGINEKLKTGDEIEFITAPKYFGDGYVMPIVSLTISGEVLLDFEEGFNNFSRS